MISFEPFHVLATRPSTTVNSSRTMVVYNPEITNYIVRFDPNWKKADIEVYDMSGINSFSFIRNNFYYIRIFNRII